MSRLLGTSGVVLCLAVSLLAQTQNSGTYGTSQPQTTPQSSTTQTNTSGATGTYGSQQTQNTQGTYGSNTNTRVVIPSGTTLQVRVNENLSSETAKSGDRFTGTLAEALTVDGRTVLPRGADVSGNVMSATPSGRINEPGTLELTVASIHFNGQTVNLTSAPLVMKGESHTKSNTTKVGGGAALGAIIGGIAGGGKGAAIGATVGAGAGAAGAAATGKKPATVESEAVLKFNTSTDTTVYLAQNAQQSDTGSSSTNSTSSSSSYPSTSSSSTYPNTSSTTSTSTYPTSSSTYPDSSSNSDQPVLRRHDTTTTAQNTSPSNSQSTSQSSAQNTGTASTGATGGMTTNTTVDRSQTPDVYTTQQTGPSSFSLRDQRVIRSCVEANASSLNASATTKNAGVQPFVRGSVLPSTLQRKVSSLPLACERQLAPAGNNTERVIYNRQVLLLDNNARILDVFSLDYQ